MRRSIVPILALAALGACNGKLECGDYTHEVDGICVGEGPVVLDGEDHTITIVDPTTIHETNTHTVEVTVPNTITNTITNTVTNTITNTIIDDELEPGQYEENLVEIQELLNKGGAVGSNGSGETHMHISEMKWRPTDNATWPNSLWYCSYTFGVLDGTNLNSMSFLAQGYKFLPRTGTRDPGCMHLTFDETDYDIVYTTHHGNLDDGLSFVSGMDMNSIITSAGPPPKITLLNGTTPTPVQLPMVQDGWTYEGLDFENGYIYVSAHHNGLAVFQRDALAGNALNKVSSYQGDLVDSRDVWVDGTVAYIPDGVGGLSSVDVTDPMNIVPLGHVDVPGVAVDIGVKNGVAYIAGQSGGLTSVDVSDPTNMAVLQNINFGQSVVAVAVDEAGGTDSLYVAAWNDTRVYDVSDPTDMVILGAKRATKQKNYAGDEGGERPDLTNRVLGVAGQGDYVFSGTWWVPHNYQLTRTEQAPFIVLPESTNFTPFPGDLAIGESSSVDIEIRNDGNAPLTVFDLWTTNGAFTVTPDELYIEPNATGTVTVTFTATLGAGTTTGGAQTGAEEGFLQVWSDDPSQPIREAYLVGNPAGIAVGDDYYNSATLLDGTAWDFETDYLGSVTMVAYFATF